MGRSMFTKGKKLLNVICGVLTMCILIAPENITKILLYLFVGGIISIVVFWKYDEWEWKHYMHGKLFFMDLAVVIMICNDFYNRWIPSSKVAILANGCHLSVKFFLSLVSMVLGTMAISFIDGAFWIGKKYIDKFLSRKLARHIFSICFALLFQYISLQFSTIESIKGVINPGIAMVLSNILILFALNLVVLLIVQEWNVTLKITSVIVCVWSIANYYVVLFHGSPLFISELRNTKTAFAVANTYSYNISLTVVLCVVILIMQFKNTYKDEYGKDIAVMKKILCRLGILTFSVIGIFSIKYYSRAANKGQWNWKEGVMNEGFVTSALTNVQNFLSPILEPEGYELSKISGLFSPDTNMEENSSKPDIIMILNESFYDLNCYTDLTTDVDYMTDFYSVPNAIYGSAVVPNVGGGTNNSEFEYLYSKSMYLLSSDAPFSYLSHTLEKRSIVQYLKNLGYTTTGMHCGGEQNYQRHTVYPTIGFDHIYLGPDAFSYITSNGNRSWKDEDNYKDLIEYYEGADDNPQFIYLLTFQNHGGYEQNDDSMDTVHIKEDLGELTDDVNEYLSSVKLSGEAFKKLTEYYKEVDRDVIICMVGDHAPSFITELDAKGNSDIDDETITMRSVPYVLWSNYGADFSMYTDYASMVDLAPMVLKGGGLPLSAFYENILNLHEVLPIRTSDGKGVNKEREIFEYSMENADKLWKQYYWLEYNSLLETDEFKEELFHVE